MTNQFFLILLGGLSLNLVLHAGLGVKEVEKELREPHSVFSFSKWAGLFIVVFLLWLFFTFVISPLSLSYAAIALLFPITIFACVLFDNVLTFGAGRKNNESVDGKYSNDDGLPVLCPLAAFALLFTLRLASGVLDALLLSLSFSAGTALSVFILSSIHRRVQFEHLSNKLKGLPYL
jgi:hypothetical protein